MSRHADCDCSRRSFLRGAGLTLAGFGVSSLFPGPFLGQAMAATPGTFSNRRLIFIFLRGGNDGLNTVIPAGDPDYSPARRPTLYIPNSWSLDLGNGFARLHPAMSALMPLFASGDLAVVHRVGYPDNTLSHFDDQRVWENGDPSRSKLFEGWLYRYIQENAVAAGFRLPALSAQENQPLLLRGAQPFVNIANPDAFESTSADPWRTKLRSGWNGVFDNLTGLEAYRPLLTQTSVRLTDVLDEYRSWSQQTWDPKDPNTGFSLFPVSDATNPGFPPGMFPSTAYEFFRSLKVCALAMLESDPLSLNGTRVAGTELTQFDTHNAQGGVSGPQAALLAQLAYGLRSLQIVLSGAATDPRGYPSIWNDTVVCTMSEFGRTSDENGSLGTDHAGASCLFVAGGGVNGGVYNCDASTWPAGTMFAKDGRYVSLRTDYRAIFWEILRDHMGADPAKVETVFPGYTALGLTEPGLIG
jgi:uncharacterized protein (DUF1501 family)